MRCCCFYITFCIGMLLSFLSLHAQQYITLNKREATVTNFRNTYEARKLNSTRLAAGFYCIVDDDSSTIHFQIDSAGNTTGKFSWHYTSVPGKPAPNPDSGYCTIEDGKAIEMNIYYQGKKVKYSQIKNGNNWLDKEFLSSGDTRITQYDEEGKLKYSKQYDANNHLVNETFFFGFDASFGFNKKIVKQYYASGKLKDSTTISLEATTILSFYENGQLQKSIVTGEGHTEIQKEYSPYGILTAEQISNYDNDIAEDKVWRTHKEYFPDGKIRKEIVSTHLHETTTTYSSTGDLLHTETRDLRATLKGELPPYPSN